MARSGKGGFPQLFYAGFDSAATATIASPPPKMPDLPRLVTKPTPPRSPMAEAMDWVSRITVIALEMVLPGLAGQWLDERFGWNFMGLVGFAFGVTAGIWHLLVMTKAVGRQGSPDDDSQKDDPS